MAIDDRLEAALKGLPPKPADDASQAAKKRYSELMSEALAQAFAAELRDRGMDSARPAPPGVLDQSGAERRLAGGLGAKKVDVSWATEEAGLILAVSVKSINFKDKRSNAFQKNLTNRRADLLMEATTLHRRFPYAVVAGFFFLDKDAEHDGTARRNSTFENVFPRFRLFSGRGDPAGRDEQFERLYFVLVDANPFQPSWRCFDAVDDGTEVPVSDALDQMIEIAAERNFDDYEAPGDGSIRKI